MSIGVDGLNHSSGRNSGDSIVRSSTVELSFNNRVSGSLINEISKDSLLVIVSRRGLLVKEVIGVSRLVGVFKSHDGLVEVFSIAKEKKEHLFISSSLIFPTLLELNIVSMELMGLGCGVSKSFNSFIVPLREGINILESLVLRNTFAHLVKHIPDVIREVVKVGIELIPMVDLRVQGVISFSHL